MTFAEPDISNQLSLDLINRGENVVDKKGAQNLINRVDG